MSGHSHWAGIKHKKAIKDAQRSQIFSKLARWLSIAARKGTNPDFNPELRLAIEKAKEANMPQENIERAIRKGSGQIEGERLESLTIEGVVPEGIMVVVESITDNRKRTLNEIRYLFEKFGGKLASGGVLWQFQRRGCITVDLESQASKLQPEDLELIAIDCDAEDLHWKEKILEIYTKPEALAEVGKKLQEKGVKIEESTLEWVPQREIGIKENEKKRLREFFEALGEHSDVKDIYFNVANL